MRNHRIVQRNESLQAVVREARSSRCFILIDPVSRQTCIIPRIAQDMQPINMLFYRRTA